MMTKFNQIMGIIGFSILLIVWISPVHIMYKRVRYQTIRALWNVMIAPFGSVTFKSYLLAEILTDCIIPI